MAISGKTILITGGAGFIGSTLAGRLCDDNQVVLFDNLSRNTLSHTAIGDHPNVRFCQGDVLDYPAVREVMRGCDTVVHAAAIAGIDTVLKAPVSTMEVNMIGTANVLRAAHAEGVSFRVVDFSTSEVFGSMAYRVTEDMQTVAGSAGEARWVYAVSKLAGEHLAHAYFKQHGLPTVTVRPFNVYGPGQTGEGAIQIFIRRALKNEPISIFGDGTQIRAWCYIDDMVDGLMCALTTIYGLAQTVCRVLDSGSAIVFREPLSADIELRIPETTKARQVLDFEAKVDLEDGIRRTAAWYMDNTI
jgi:UDP-glucose 4-epimerase